MELGFPADCHDNWGRLVWRCVHQFQRIVAVSRYKYDDGRIPLVAQAAAFAGICLVTRIQASAEISRNRAPIFSLNPDDDRLGSLGTPGHTDARTGYERTDHQDRSEFLQEIPGSG